MDYPDAILFIVLDRAFTLGVAATRSAVKSCPKPAAWSMTLKPGTPRMTAQLKIEVRSRHEASPNRTNPECSMGEQQRAARAPRHYRRSR